MSAGRTMEKIFLQMLNMGITAGYCVLVVILLRLLFKKLPKLYSYILWGVVYFRLVCPVSVKSVFSLVKVNPQTIPNDIGTRIKPRITSGVPQVDAVVNTGLVQAAPRVENSVNPMQVMLSVAVVIWIVGVLLLFAYSVWSMLRLKWQLKDACQVEGNIFEVENLKTPFVVGVFSPCIYLPAGIGERERCYVLAHEKTHIRRKDHLIKLAAFLVTCFYWVHPLIWLAFYLMCRDMEMSCDESVIRSMGTESKKEYSAALLSLASGRQILNGSPLAFGEGEIKSRIINVLHYKPPVFWVSALFAVALAAVLLGLALNPKELYAEDQANYNAETRFDGQGDKAILQSDKGDAFVWEKKTGDADRSSKEHREGFKKPLLYFHVTGYLADSDYIDTDLLTTEESEALAVLALQELYDLTGTQVEECYYYYTTQGSFVFAMSEEDMDRDRAFYTRSFGEEDFAGAISIPQMWLTNARRIWYSPVYQYELPEDFTAYEDSEKAVWFLEHSAVYHGGTVADCWQTYGDAMPEVWRIAMEDGTAYEVTLDTEIDAVSDITGPYATSDFEH